MVGAWERYERDMLPLKEWDWAIVDAEGHVYELVCGGRVVAESYLEREQDRTGETLSIRRWMPGDYTALRQWNPLGDAR